MRILSEKTFFCEKNHIFAQKITYMMKKLIVIAIATLALTACQKSMEDRAEAEARAYTQKYCPTPVYNFTRTDSLVFDRTSRTFVYHCSLTDEMDDSTVISQNSEKLRNGLLQSIRESTNLRVYKEAEFSFRYLVRSAKNPQQVLFDATFKQEDYK